MVFLTNSLLADLFLGITAFAFLLYKMWTRKYNYWEKRNVPYMKPVFPFGTLSPKLFNGVEHFSIAHQRMYNQFKKQKYFGTYALTEPQLMVRDPEIIKHIMTKDFNDFVDRSIAPIAKHDFLSYNLFNLEGEPWKKMRSKLSPTFTSGKMKFMFNLIEVVSKQLSEYLTPLAETKSIVEMKDLAARFNTDIIASCAFGLDVDSLKNPNSEFREIGRLITEQTFWKRLVLSLMLFAPNIANTFSLRLNPPKVNDFILNVLKDTLEYRKKNNVVRNDFIDMLTKVKEKSLTVDKEGHVNGDFSSSVSNSSKGPHSYTIDNEFTVEEMAAQVFIFFAAGFETAASTSSFCLFELSKNKIIQDKVRAEIDCVIKKHGDKVTYQALQELTYMEQCIDETLRRYASLPFLQRQCVNTYKVPDSDLVIEKGIKVLIPTYSIHHDPEYYPDPFKFDPERFSEDAVNSRHRYAHLPFGEGPRMCIGKRLGIMQMKMAIITVLKDFEVTPSPDLPDQLPISTRLTITTSAVPINLVLSKRKA